MATIQLAIVYLTTLFAPAPLPKPPNLNAFIIGDWEVESVTREGKVNAAQGKPAQGVMRITEDRVQLITGGQKQLEVKYKLDASKQPAALDVTLELDKGARPMKLPLSGIVMRRAGKLVICVNGQPSGDRPTKFESSKENHCMLFELKRAPVEKE